MNIIDFAKKKVSGEKIVMVTAYDFPSAQLIAKSDIDCVLVGDSAAMTVHGYQNTTSANVDLLIPHVAAVARGLGRQFLVADLPFLSYRINQTETMSAVMRFIQAGAHAVKLEGAEGNLATISHIVNSGVPVMGHLGLTPQAIHQLGGFKVQAKTEQAAKTLMLQAKQLQDAGCFALVLECVPAETAALVSQALAIPTIGIGAGPDTDGQVLVWHDLLGLNNEFKPKFLKQYANLADQITTALNGYAAEVRSQHFPLLGEHSY